MRYLLLTVMVVIELVAVNISAAQSEPDNIIVYDDDLLAPWFHTTFNSSVTLVSTEQQYTGEASMKFEATSPWGWVSMVYGPWNSPGLDTSPYERVEFAIYPTTRETSVAVFFENEEELDFPKIARGVFDANTWTVVSVPISELNPGGHEIKRLFIQEFSGETKTFYVDNIRIVTQEDADPPVPSPPSAPTLSRPEDGATNISLTPTLGWNEVDNADAYRLQVAADGAFSQIEYSVSGITSVSHQVTRLEPSVTYYWRVQASNAEGESAWSQSRSFTTQTGELAITEPALQTVWLTGTVQSIRWESDAGSGNVNLYYSTDDGAKWDTIDQDLAISTGSYNWQLPDTPAMNARIRIINSGDEQVQAISEPFIIYPASVQLSTTYSFDNSADPADYRLIGMPAMTDLRVDELFPGNHPDDWRVFFDNGDSDDYLTEFNHSDLFRFRPGAGFWAISRRPVELNINANSVRLSADTTHTIPLHSGWNIISNPFIQPVSWSSVQAANNVTDPAWSFEGDYSQSSVLQPFVGYYFFNRNDLDGLKIPWPDPQSLEASSAPQTDWITLSVHKNGVQRASVGIGFDPEKSEIPAYAKQPAPPADLLEVNLAIVHEGGESTDVVKYAAEYRPSIGDMQEYRLMLKSITDETLEFKLSGIEQDGQYSIYLVSNPGSHQSRFYKLDPGNRISVRPEAKITSWKLIIGSANAIDHLRNESTPDVFTLAQNYPNPFNTQTVLEYTIPQSANNELVRLDIYTIDGRLINTLVNERQPAGRYQVRWDGTGLASGMYLYRLRAGSFSKTRYMTLIK